MDDYRTYKWGGGEGRVRKNSREGETARERETEIERDIEGVRERETSGIE